MHGITGSTKVQRLAKVDERLEFFEVHCTGGAGRETVNAQRTLNARRETGDGRRKGDNKTQIQRYRAPTNNSIQNQAQHLPSPITRNAYQATQRQLYIILRNKQAVLKCPPLWDNSM